jgi:branched-subunit amino acid transport protein
MTTQEIWITIGLMAASTLMTRGSFFLLGNAVRLPPRVRHALRYAPAAALAAIVAPDFFLSGGSVDISLANPKLWAGVGATVFFMLTRHLLGTIVIGMALFTILRLFGQ